jgi:DNA-binding MarR family transcriptional regulator
MHDELLEMLATLSNGFSALLSEASALKEAGLTHFHGKVLAMIGRDPGVSQQTIAARVSRDKAQVARSIKDLETRGLVRREAHATDWRAQSLYLTPPATTLFDTLQAQRSQLGKGMMQDLTPGEMADLGAILTKMQSRLSANTPV